MDLSSILTSLQQGVAAINNLSQKIASAFPQGGVATSTTASSGAATLPAAPAAFTTVTINGTPYKIPLYNP